MASASWICSAGVGNDWSPGQPPSSALTDRDSGVGFRGQASLGLNFALSESVVASLFGALDYWSDMPFAKTQVPNQPGVPASLGDDDAIDLRAGVKLTLHLD